MTGPRVLTNADPIAFALAELDDLWGGIAGLAITGRDDTELDRLRKRRVALLAEHGVIGIQADETIVVLPKDPQ